MVVVLAALPATAALAGSLGPNPANDPRLIDEPLEDYRYDYAERCVDRPRDGALALSRWMDRHLRGELWGIVRCSRLSSGWSVHSEGRAIDWRLDAGVPGEKRSAMRFIGMLLEADERGRQHALARRMGVQGIIFDCKAWWSGMSGLGRYGYCYDADGDIRDNLDRTQAHRDHVHVELNWPGARERTSFWRSPLADE
jgi:hypothetical protein